MQWITTIVHAYITSD